jgi:hypothetical protein
MDCEKFESVMMDELYGELDELTSAAAKRHIAGCARCSSRIGGLRATRRVAVVPLVDPAPDLEERILGAAERAWIAAPPRPRLAQVISLAGSWAMRPQTATAAVFLVMIGTSVLLLRGKSARAPVGDEVTVTEQGTPAPVAPTSSGSADSPVEPSLAKARAPAPGAEAKAPAAAPAYALREAPATAGGGAGAARGAAESTAFKKAERSDEQADEPFDAAVRSYRAGRFDEATRAFDALAPSDANAPDLWAARSVRESKGCRAAVARFDRTATRRRRTSPGWDALLEGGLCYRALGELSAARSRLTSLLDVDSHKDRARAELDRIDDLQAAQGGVDNRVGTRTPSRARPAAPAGAPASPVPPAAAQSAPASGAADDDSAH